MLCLPRSIQFVYLGVDRQSGVVKEEKKRMIEGERGDWEEEGEHEQTVGETVGVWSTAGCLVYVKVHGSIQSVIVCFFQETLGLQVGRSILQVQSSLWRT